MIDVAMQQIGDYTIVTAHTHTCTRYTHNTQKENDDHSYDDRVYKLSVFHNGIETKSNRVQKIKNQKDRKRF